MLALLAVQQWLCAHGKYGLPADATDLEAYLGGPHSITATDDGGTGCRPEGIVAKSEPLLFTRRGDRVMWKLKFRDFPTLVGAAPYTGDPTPP